MVGGKDKQWNHPWIVLGKRRKKYVQDTLETRWKTRLDTRPKPIVYGELQMIYRCRKEKATISVCLIYAGRQWTVVILDMKTPNFYCDLQEWAKHTGRYREGVDERDYATWKTRLRCAFNKAPDIQEVKDMTNLDAVQPFRVYRLLPKKRKFPFLRLIY